MGVFQHPVTVVNAAGDEIETIDLWVDTNSLYTWLPARIRDRLGIEPSEMRGFLLANGMQEARPVAQVRISLGGAPYHTFCAFAEDGDACLLGALAVSEAGLAIDPVHGRLVPAVMRW